MTKANQNNSNDATVLSEEDVSDYLKLHPSFLMDKPSLLAEMSLPHPTEGKTVSLIERQVSVLRDRNMDMRHRLSMLLDNARINDHLFELSRRLILALLDARQIDDCLDVLFYTFQNDFDIHYSKLLLINPPGAEFPMPVNCQAVVINRDLAEDALSSVIHNRSAICGQLKASECRFICHQHAENIGSTAVAPLYLENRFLGVLAIANRDPDYYRSSMNTMFLNFIADVMSRILAGYLKDTNQ